MGKPEFLPADAKALLDHLSIFRRPNIAHAIMGMEFIEYHSIPEPNSGCWLWLGALDRSGYGRIRAKRIGEAYAHRYCLSLSHGPLGDLHALHKCDNPICVNPDHLFAGTNADNNRDMMKKGRNIFLRGEDSPHTKITKNDVLEIRASSDTFAALASKFSISIGAVSHIRGRRSWRHLDG